MRMAWMLAWILLAAAPAALGAPSAPTDDTESSAAQRTETKIPITPPKSTDPKEKDKNSGGLASTAAILGSLALVLGLFFLIVWALRKTSPNAWASLPSGAFEGLGRAPLAFRQQAMIVRCGNKLLLISTGIGGTEPLLEITEPAEVERLTELCRQARTSAGATALFRNLFQKKEGRHA